MADSHSSQKLENKLQEICEDAMSGVNIQELQDDAEDGNVRGKIIDKLIEALQMRRDEIGLSPTSSSSKKRRQSKETNRNKSAPPPLILSAERKALGNPLILTKILTFLDPASLKTSRQISSFWNLLSIHILNKHRFLQLSFYYDVKYNAYFLKTPTLLTTTTLSQINDSIHYSLQNSLHPIPCQSFFFTNGLCETPSFTRFLSIYGSTLKCLKFNFTATSQRSEKIILRHLLFNSTPNLETLHFVSIPGTPAWQNLYSPERWSRTPRRLPALRHLIVNGNIFASHESIVSVLNLLRMGGNAARQQIHFWFQLLQAGINLLTLSSGRDYPESFLTPQIAHAAVVSSKSNLIRELQYPIHCSDSVPFEVLEDPNNPGILLEKLYIKKSDSLFHTMAFAIHRHVTPLDRILRSSAGTLTLLHISGHLPTEVQLPIFTRLTSLCLRWDYCHGIEVGEVPLLNNGLVCSAGAPNLNSLSLDFSRVEINKRNVWGGFDRVFPFMDVTESVRVLKIISIPQSDWMDNLAGMFPRCKELTVGMIKSWPSVGRKIWTQFRRLEKLNVEILVGSRRSCNMFPELEAIFTGFSKGVCKKLKADLESVSNLEKWRKYPSIRDLTELRNLEVTFSHTSHYDSDSVNKLLSRVTGRFALGLMPYLQTRIIGKGYANAVFSRAMDPMRAWAQICVVKEESSRYEFRARLFTFRSSVVPLK